MKKTLHIRLMILMLAYDNIYTNKKAFFFIERSEINYKISRFSVFFGASSPRQKRK